MNRLTGEIIGAAIEVHRVLGGPGLLEDLYVAALAYEAELRGLTVKREVPVPVFYKGHGLKKPLYIDLLVPIKSLLK